MAGYRELEVWKLGVDLSLDIYRLTADFPKHEIYGLVSQMRRASVSIPSNLAEGHGRNSKKELQRFARIAKGSLAELETQLIISEKLGYVAIERVKDLLMKTEQESRMLSGLIRSLD